MSLRICRHCRKPVPLSVERCPHCKGKLHPKQFAIMLTAMSFILLCALSAVVYGAVAYKNAHEALYCRHYIYGRATGPEDLSCQTVCEDKCSEKDMSYRPGLLLTTSVSPDEDTTISCECVCTGCQNI